MPTNGNMGTPRQSIGKVRQKVFLRPDVRREVWIGASVIAVTTLTAAAQGNVYWLQVFLIVDLYLASAVSLNLLRGEAGQVSFGQGAIFGVGAYATAMLAAKGGLSLLIALPLGVLASVVVGLLLALPALRVQGYYLGFITLAAAIVFPDLLFAFNEYTDAITGISIPVLHLKEPVFWRFDGLTLIITSVAILSLYGHGVVRSSRLGRRMRVAAASPEAALSLGISPGRMRVIAFTMAALGTGLAGALYVPLVGFVSPGAFPLFLSVFLYFSVVVGGQGTLLGPLAGVYLLYIVPNVLLVDLVRYRLLLYGSMAFAIMMFFPDGLIGSLKNALVRLRRKADAPVSVEASITRAAELGTAASQVHHAAADMAVHPIITMTAVSKSFGRVKALDDVSIRVLPGELFGLVGPNGSGKTTLLNSVSGLIRPDRGQTVINGVDVTRWGPRSIADLGVGRTFQTPIVFEDLTVWENVDIKDVGVDGGAAWLRESLAAVRPQWERAASSSLPHAQRRLLEIVRVLWTNPRILLLDEPAAGLSSDERDKLGELLLLLVETSGATVVLVEHDLNLVWKIADRLAVMDEGRVVVSGTPSEVMESPFVEMLFAGVPLATS